MPPPAPSPSHGDPPAPTIVELGRRPLHSSDRVVRPYGLSWGNRLSPSRCHPSREPSSPRLIERDRNLSVRTLLSTATFPHGRPSIESLDLDSSSSFLDHRYIYVYILYTCPSMLSTRRRPFHTVKSPVSIFHDSSDFTSDTLDPLFVSSFLSSFLFFFLPLTTVFPLFLSFPLYENTLVRIGFVVRGSRSVTKLAHSLHRRLTYYIARHGVVAKKRRTNVPRGNFSSPK